AASEDKSACNDLHKHFSRMTIHSRLKAVEAMGILGCDLVNRATRSETHLMLSHRDSIRGAAMVAHAKTHKDRAFWAIYHTYLNPIPGPFGGNLRSYMPLAASHLSPNCAIPLLKRMLKDESSMVRLAALESLAGFMPESSDVFVPLLLHSSDFPMRAIAAQALGKTKDRKYLNSLIAAYDISSRPSEIEARAAILDALVQFNDSSALEVYRKALLDPEYSIRAHAVDGIRKLVGSDFYWHGAVIDPEIFLHTMGKVMPNTANKYPDNFGEPLPYYYAVITFNYGTARVVLRLLGRQAPVHVLNFKKLAERGFYNGLTIHRVVPNFVVQGGDPRGDGWGNAGELVRDQINLMPYKRGTVGMPLAGKDTGGSQFFITLSRQPHLDGNYTVFGEVIDGMDFLDRCEIGGQISNVEILAEPPPHSVSRR
ncbi:MAG TPA: peptidylprolyl isomerase, partial [Acidobacteriota bacterium]|nr:peptidylprolyl isomerase [Acidobacteriota bacterium]